MLKLTGLKVPARMGADKVRAIAAKTLGVKESSLTDFKILRRSVDSRKKPDVFFLFTVAFSIKNESRYLSRADVSRYTEDSYTFPTLTKAPHCRPVVVGMGPAGLFAALVLVNAGLKPLILERGQPVEQRTQDVHAFWEGGTLNTSSNVQFGEGGAGTFSDGKLTTGIKDGRIPFVLRTFVQHGAPADIEYLAKPHIGTDKLRIVVANMRRYLIAHGAEIRFGAQLSGIEEENGALCAISVKKSGTTERIPATHLILAPGNSARDTFRMLHASGVPMSPKSFAVGVRIEHLQKDVDLSQYGQAATLGTLPASDYKLAVHLEDGRGVFTFCVCPGGSVVAAASEEGGVVTNGMSEYARDQENINGGLLVSVTEADFDGLFGGMDFQRDLETASYHLGDDYLAPAQTVGDFLAHKPSSGPGKVHPSYRPGVHWCDLHAVLPEFITRSLEAALPMMGRKIRGFDSPDAVLTAVETRSSCPVRILRDETMQSVLRGLYPCGEGAGYAGGITSAAVDGMRCAEALIQALNKE